MNIFKIFDHAHQRKAWVENAAQLSPQISENILLISLVRANLLPEANLNHWKSELRAHIDAIARNKLKGNDAPNSRLRALTEAWGVSEINTDEWLRYLSTSVKLEKEGALGIFTMQKGVVSDYRSILKELSSFIASKNHPGIYNYIQGL